MPGYILIADRNNNRILIVSPGKKVVWSKTGLRGPDDAFFTPGFHSVITNEEFNDTLTEVSLRTGNTIWTYGHAQVAGSSPGYLNTPDDAYRLSDGTTTVADIRNCRIVQLRHDKSVKRILGGSCSHNPPYGFASPNGDTPLPGRWPARDGDRGLDRPPRPQRPPGVVRTLAGLVPVRRTAPPERANPRLVLHGARQDRRDDDIGNRHVVVW